MRAGGDVLDLLNFNLEYETSLSCSSKDVYTGSGIHNKL